MMNEPIIIFEMDDGSEKTVSPTAKPRRCSGMVLTLAQPVTERVIEAIMHDIESRIGKRPAITYAETEIECYDRIAEGAKTAGVKSHRVLPRADYDAELAARVKIAEVLAGG